MALSRFSSTWQLTELYRRETFSSLASDFARADRLVQKLQGYRGTIGRLSGRRFLTLLREWERLAFLLHKFDLYTHLLESTHVGVARVTRLAKKIDEAVIARSKEVLFIEAELSHLRPERWQTLIANPALKPYQRFLERQAELARHTLSEDEEKILAEKTQTSGQALSQLYSLTTDTLTFQLGRKRLSLEALLALNHDPRPSLRRRAALALHKGLQVNDKTTPTILNRLIQDKAITDRLRGFTSPEEARYLSEEVEPQIVQSLIAAVEAAHDLVPRYYRLKKKILKVRTLWWWDRYAPLPISRRRLTAKAARGIVEAVYSDFSPEVGAITQALFTRRHVDWFPRRPKQAGAFCAPAGKDIYPYVLLNYTGTLHDVLTTSHEVGHAIHDVLAQGENVFFQTHPSLVLAEIASTFGELLVLDKLLASKVSDQEAITLLMAQIEEVLATVFRQVAMFQFEQKLHRRRGRVGELSRNQIDALWHEAMARPFTQALRYTPEHRNSWMYVSHIFTLPFYVFSYAAAQLCALSLYHKYRKEGQRFVPTYLAILKAGGSLKPKDNLRRAGFDLTRPDFWQEGLAVIEEDIARLAQIARLARIVGQKL